jgi:chromosome segregation ATPase
MAKRRVEEDLEELLGIVRTQKASRSELESEVERLTYEIGELKIRQVNQQSSSSTASEDFRVSSLESEIQLLTDEYETAFETNETLMGLLTNANQQIASLNKSIEEVKSTRSSLLAEFKIVQFKTDKVANQMKATVK